MTDRPPTSDQALAAALESMPIPAAIARQDDAVLLYVNRWAAEALGESPQTLIGAKLTDVFADPAAIADLVHGLQHQDIVHRVEFQGLLRDGRQVCMLASMRRIEYAGTLCFLASGIDIIEQKRAQEHLRRMAEFRERDRRWIGLEIHDGAVQDMTGALMMIEAAASDARAGRGDKAAASLDKVVELLRGTIIDARGLINGLRPPVLSEHGLIAALENLCQEMSFSTATEFRVMQSDVPSLDADLESALYRIAQEAMANARKHSQATRVELHLEATNNDFRMRVDDDGLGMQRESDALSGVGLAGIRERVELLGGSADFSVSPLGGVRVQVAIPRQ